MAIIKIGLYRRPPQNMEDFDGISELLMAYAREVHGQGMVLTEWTNSDEYPKLSKGTYIFHGGASYLVDGEDYDIGEPGNGDRYLKVEASGDTLEVSWVSSLSGYTWNAIYSGLYHPSGSQILPYQLTVSGSTIKKWKITNLAQGGNYILVDWQGIVNFVKATSIEISDAEIDHAKMNRADPVNFAGMVAAFAMTAPPPGWLECNHQYVSKTTYANLYAAIGTTYGESGGNFRLPDLRGEFIRGLDRGRGVDSGRGIGTAQGSQMQQHGHEYTDSYVKISGSGIQSYLEQGDAYKIEQKQLPNPYTGAAGGTSNSSENRPRNVALLYCIKF